MKTVLWSGGFDSTYLVIDRLLQGESVQPLYIAQSDGWQKQIRERDAMDRIRFALPGDLRSHLAPAQEWIAWRDVIASIEPELRKVSRSTTVQNAALAAVGVDAGPVEVALVSEDRTAHRPAVLAWLRSHRVELPMLASTKHAILARARVRGYEDLLGLTWSCEGPNADAAARPCAACEPCEHRILPQRVRA